MGQQLEKRDGSSCLLIMDVDDILREDGKLHRNEKGESVSWKVSEDLLRFLDQHVQAEANTLETGAGLSTIFFALKGCHHTCVEPDAELVKRIKLYCQQRNISTQNIKFLIGGSDRILPVLGMKDLDVVLIDGQHGFPVPFIDWYYTAGALKVNGLVVVDDTQIWTGAVLRDFLLTEPNWKLIAALDNRCAVFEKSGKFIENKAWFLQEYIFTRSKTRWYSRFLPRMTAALRLARNRRFASLFKRVVSTLFARGPSRAQ